MAKEYKEISCRDAGIECDFRVRAETEEEVLEHCASHACRSHGKCEISFEDKEKIKPYIKTVAV